MYSNETEINIIFHYYCYGQKITILFHVKASNNPFFLCRISCISEMKSLKYPSSQLVLQRHIDFHIKRGQHKTPSLITSTESYPHQYPRYRVFSTIYTTSSSICRQRHETQSAYSTNQQYIMLLYIQVLFEATRTNL